MPAIRENRATASEASDVATLQDLAPFALIRNELPPDLHPDVRELLQDARRMLVEHRPEEVEAVVAYTRASWSQKASKVTFYVTGQFETIHAGTWAMSQAVGELALRHDPHVYHKAMPPYKWEAVVEAEADPYRYVKRRGILLYG